MRNNHLSERCMILLLLMNIIALTLLACAPQQAPAPESKIVEKAISPAAQAETSWEQQWEDLIRAAKKEGRLSIYSGLESETVVALREGFGKKYGITMEIVTGKSAQLDAKLFTERQNNLYIPDLYVQGPTPAITEYKPRGILQRLDGLVFRPDVLDEKVWRLAHGPFFDKGHYMGGGGMAVSPPVTVNTTMVRPEEFTSYNDLLDPRWKGKIVVGDPTIGGGAESAMVGALIIMGEEYIKKLAGQAAAVIADQRITTDWVARGKVPIAFGTGTSQTIAFIREGVPLEIVTFKEGHRTSSSGVVVLFNPHPNPNAARLFINWFLTREAQQAYSIASGKQSRRIDVTADHVLPFQRMKEGIQYLLSDEEFYLKRPQYMEIISKYYKR